MKEILIELNIPAKTYMRDDAFTTKTGIVKLHPTEGTHWARFVDDFYFDSNDCPPQKNVMNQIIRRIYSENQIQRKYSYFASYCLYGL